MEGRPAAEAGQGPRRIAAFAVGTDIVSVARVAELLASPGTARWFTASERDYCLAKAHPERHFAGRLAAKEAVFKAIGSTGGEHVPWAQIEVLPDSRNPPRVVLHGYLAELALQAGVFIQLSIAHCDEYATAIAVAVPLTDTAARAADDPSPAAQPYLPGWTSGTG